MVFPNDLTPSLSAFYDKTLDANDILVDNSTLEDISMLDSFQYYLFSYDDVNARLGIISCRGSKLVGWSTWLVIMLYESFASLTPEYPHGFLNC